MLFFIPCTARYHGAAILHWCLLVKNSIAPAVALSSVAAVLSAALT